MLDTHLYMQGGDLIHGSSQDVSAILANAQALHKEGFHGTSEMKHAARLPLIVVEKYCNDHNISFHEFMGNRDHIKSVLNDPSLSAFRIWKGQV